ncbi:MAG: PilZ domain-containing protein, partial [Myxococcales bacterium]|nr:PilZ domain-containing protein [Myxococcales bacterium]
MEGIRERYLQRPTRVPVDDGVVLWRPEGEGAHFEADLLDAGLGGVKVRAPVLPDVGARLACEVELPNTGDAFTAGAEVVWVQDRGPNLGELGLRFTDLDTSGELRLRALVDAFERRTAESPTAPAVQRPTRAQRQLELIALAPEPAARPNGAHLESPTVKLPGVERPATQQVAPPAATTGGYVAAPRTGAPDAPSDRAASAAEGSASSAESAAARATPQPSAEADAPAAHEAEAAVEAERVRSVAELQLEGVATPLVAEVVYETEHALVVEQALPFLRLGTSVAERGSGRQGALATVDLRIEGDTPRLVLRITEAPPEGAVTHDREPEALAVAVAVTNAQRAMRRTPGADVAAKSLAEDSGARPLPIPLSDADPTPVCTPAPTAAHATEAGAGSEAGVAAPSDAVVAEGDPAVAVVDARSGSEQPPAETYSASVEQSVLRIEDIDHDVWGPPTLGERAADVASRVRAWSVAAVGIAGAWLAAAWA